MPLEILLLKSAHDKTSKSMDTSVVLSANVSLYSAKCDGEKYWQILQTGSDLSKSSPTFTLVRM